jgi:phosphatidylglycerophosphatase A
MNGQKLFLTFFGAGLSPKAPGTVGTLAAMPVGLAILYYLGMETLFLITVVITIIGVFEINEYEKTTGIHDHQQIVIDEAAGVWLTLMIAISATSQVTYPYAEWSAIVLSFLAFRLFDIWKPSTIGKIDRDFDGGLGVMGDDILAGIAGGLFSAMIMLGTEKALAYLA